MISVMKYWGIYIALFFCTVTHFAAAEVTVAVITPKAGDYAVQGQELTRGAQKAVEEINAAGGLKKQKIKVLDIDDQCRDSTAVSTAQMLSLGQNHKISLVIGPYCANAFAEVAQIYAKAKTVSVPAIIFEVVLEVVCITIYFINYIYPAINKEVHYDIWLWIKYSLMIVVSFVSLFLFVNLCIVATSRYKIDYYDNQMLGVYGGVRG